MRRQAVSQNEAKHLLQYKRLSLPKKGFCRSLRESLSLRVNKVIGIGHREQNKHKEFKELVKSKGFRTLLRKAGYKVLLGDEFRTSCQCSHCQTETTKCEKFGVRLDPKTKKSTEDVYL